VSIASRFSLIVVSSTLSFMPQAYAAHAHIVVDRRNRALIPWSHCKLAHSSMPIVDL